MDDATADRPPPPPAVSLRRSPSYWPIWLPKTPGSAEWYLLPKGPVKPPLIVPEGSRLARGPNDLPAECQLPGFQVAWQSDISPKIEVIDDARRLRRELEDVQILAHLIILGDIIKNEGEVHAALREIGGEASAGVSNAVIRLRPTAAVDYAAICAVAEKITGGFEPVWLVRGLLVFARIISCFRAAEKAYPRVTEWRRRLKFIRKACIRLIKQPQINENVKEGLHDIVLRSEAALVVFPGQQGRNLYYPGVKSPFEDRDLCALVVAVAWQKARGVWPGDIAYAACETLWVAAGGDHAKGEDFAPAYESRWSRNLTVAKSHSGERQAFVIQRAFGCPFPRA
jgi:hypothetical protein